MSFFGFHPLIERWFQKKFAGPTEPQQLGWPSIAAGQHTLIAAPTGSGKTLTAFMAVIDRLLKASIAGDLEAGTRVVYVSPLRALSNDMHRNLSEPLAELNELATAEFPDVPISFLRVGLRTGDSTPAQRAALVKRPPHIVVTTPESLFMLLTTERGRAALKTVETIIVDEIHALIRDKRGSHLALTLERLDALCERRVQRIGLSATQKPIERVAEFLVGASEHVESKLLPSPLRGEGSGVRGSCNSGVTPPNARTGGSASSHGTIRNRDEPAAEQVTSESGLGDRNPSPPTPLSAGARGAGELCQIINVGHRRDLDLAIEVPPSELSAVCSNEQWAEVNARIVELINSHRSTLIFVNTRRMAERVTHQLTELLGEDQVGSHHGSLSSELRLRTEQRLKTGELKAVVATASLELGLDVGYLDLVIQIGSPRSIATFLQRIGRSGHSLGKTPKGRLFALTRDELIECMSLIRAIRAGRLDSVPIPEAPLDVLLQQIVAEVAAREWNTDDLFAMCRRAWPYRHLTRSAFDASLGILSEGLTDKIDRQLLYLHHDRVGHRVRARPNARIAATTNAGAIPENAQYRVVSQPEGTVVGTLDEDFAIESHAGQIFLLGNTSWRIEGLRGTDMNVTDAGGAPPTIPFWRGEAPGRTLELSQEVSGLRREIEARLRALPPSPPRGEGLGVRGDRKLDLSTTTPFEAGLSETTNAVSDLGDKSPSPPTPLPKGARGVEDDVAAWLIDATSCSEFAARQTVNYVAAQMAAVGLVPTQKRVIFERFFDETGGMQMVVHAPFGARITQAWGLAMRKRFCVSFDFELQATADDDGFILSLGPQHSFPLESMFPMLTPENLRDLLEIAILRIPMFQIRWRWNVNRALLVLRRDKGKKVPPALQRFRSDDLLTACFPMLTGCQENVTEADLKLPDHPLVQQTMHDCLSEALDFDGLIEVLKQIQTGEIELLARDTREPSPFSYELLNSNPYAFLDGGEIQERRARSVSTRRSLTVESVSDLGRLDPLAIEQVLREAAPLIRNADELHDVLLSRVVVLESELADYEPLFEELVAQRRATRFELPPATQSVVPPSPLRGEGLGVRGDPKLDLPPTEPSETEELVAERLLTGGPTETTRSVSEQWEGEAPAEPQPLQISGSAGASPSRNGLLGQTTRTTTNAVRTLGDRSPSSPTPLPEGARGVGRIWCCADRLPAVIAMFPQAVFMPTVEVPDGVRTDWTGIDARIVAVRGLMEVAGPQTHLEVAARLGMSPNQAAATLEALEGEGAVLRGRFRGNVIRHTSGDVVEIALSRIQPRPALTAPLAPLGRGAGGEGLLSAEPRSRTEFAIEPTRCSPPPTPLPAGARGDIATRSTTGAPAITEWCHRRLLARIHRLTMDGLRREIEPVCVAVFFQFLAQHHGLNAAHRRAGSSGLFEVIALLQGLDLPAVAWERDILRARLQDYQPEWLDELCLTGEVGWGRLYPPSRDPERSGAPANLTRIAPVSLFLRDDLPWLIALNSGSLEDTVSETAQRVRTAIEQRGALFGADLRTQLSISNSELDDVLGELISRGQLTADGFAGLRHFLVSRSDSHLAPKLPARLGVARQRMATAGAGRWSLWRPDRDAESVTASPPIRLDAEIEQWAWQLLRRWGVIFKDLLQRELGAPRWWQLLQVYRQLEARGEIRGGRFISGVAGEQFALADTVQKLRKLRDLSQRPAPAPAAAIVNSVTSQTGWTYPGTSPVSTRSRARRDSSRRTQSLRQSFMGESEMSKSLQEAAATSRSHVSERGSNSPSRESPESVGEIVILSAVDPLNLIGILTSDERVPAVPSNRIALVHGIPVAALVNQDLVVLGAMSDAVKAAVEVALNGDS